MKLSEIGEFGLIQKFKQIAEKFPLPPALVTTIGDDSAAWKNEPGIALASTDCLIEGVHFTLETTSWYALGWKSMAVNLSDIAAMGGRARYALITLGIPPTIEVEDILQLYHGMVDLGAKYGVSITGGDTSSAPIVFINVSIFGNARGTPLTRASARTGDKIAVSGCPGTAAAGWKLLQQGSHKNSDSALIQAFLKPQPRLNTGKLLLAEGVATAIDISDGLKADLEHICQQSKVSAVVNTSQLPLHPEAIKLFGKQKSLEMALSGGEDYELLFCAPETIVNRVKSLSEIPISIIGEITAYEPGVVTLMNAEGKPVLIHSVGWQHFA